MLSKIMSRIVLGAVVCAASSGCYQWEPVKVSSLPDLDRPVVAEWESSDRVAFRGVKVERPDGTLIHLHGGFELEITREDGKTLQFESPVSIKRDGNRYLIAGENRARTAIPVERIRKAEVSQLDIVSTVLLTTSIAVAVGLGAGYAATASGN